MSALRPWLGDERPSLDEVCNSQDKCTEECPAYKFCITCGYVDKVESVEE